MEWRGYDTTRIGYDICNLSGIQLIQAYPFNADGVKIVSPKHSIMLAEKFTQNFNLRIAVLLVTTFCALVISLKYVLQQPVYDAILVFIWLLVNAPTLKEPHQFYKKLLFLTLFFAIFITNSYIQSNLTAINTVPARIPMIDSIDDFLRSYLVLYSPSNCIELIKDSDIQKRSKVMDECDECFALLYQGNHIACVICEPERGISHVYEN